MNRERADDGKPPLARITKGSFKFSDLESTQIKDSLDLDVILKGDKSKDR